MRVQLDVTQAAIVSATAASGIHALTVAAAATGPGSTWASAAAAALCLVASTAAWRFRNPGAVAATVVVVGYWAALVGTDRLLVGPPALWSAVWGAVAVAAILVAVSERSVRIARSRRSLSAV